LTIAICLSLNESRSTLRPFEYLHADIQRGFMHNEPMSNTTRLAGFSLLAITCTGWAMNWAFIKLLLREWPPLFSRGVSGVAAGLLLAIVATRRGESLKVPHGAWGALLVASFTNVFAWMGFGTAAMVDLSISEATLLVYSMPIWAMLFSWPMLGIRPHAREFAALTLGIAGVAVLFAGQAFALDAAKLAGIGFALAAAILFAFGSVRTQAPLPIAPVATVAWQVGLGCLPMVLFGLLVEQPDLTKLSGTGAAVLIYMILGPMGLCYLTWFAALQRLPASTAALGTLTVPVIGVIAATLVLGEPLGARQVIAAALTLGGVALAIKR
jgi:drug/metabolite transporter (DMT)-like permease